MVALHFFSFHPHFKRRRAVIPRDLKNSHTTPSHNKHRRGRRFRWWSVRNGSTRNTRTSGNASM